MYLSMCAHVRGVELGQVLPRDAALLLGVAPRRIALVVLLLLLVLGAAAALGDPLHQRGDGRVKQDGAEREALGQRGDEAVVGGLVGLGKRGSERGRAYGCESA